MLFLQFYVGDSAYALETSKVVEVVPLVIFTKVYQVPKYVTGVFNYRGLIVPAFDFSIMINGNPSRSFLSTRIIILNYPKDDGHPRYLGLIVEKVTETINKPLSELSEISSSASDSESYFLDRMMFDDKNMIQTVKLENLLSDSQRDISKVLANT
jgi:chemotaxis-related protein WspB